MGKQTGTSASSPILSSPLLTFEDEASGERVTKYEMRIPFIQAIPVTSFNYSIKAVDDIDLESEVLSFFNDLASKQRDLPTEAAKILYDNLSEL